MSIQDIKFLISWGTSAGLPPSSALPAILALLETSPACTETVLQALQTFLLGALGKIFQVSTPKQARGGNKDGDANSLNEAIRTISVHLLGVLQKNSVQWAPIITKWVIGIFRLAEPPLPADSHPSLEILLAARLKQPSLKHLSSLLASSWLFLTPTTCIALLDEMLAGYGTEVKRQGATVGELDWVLALVGVQDPERALQLALSHLARIYLTLDPRQQPAQQLAQSRAGKLIEFLSFRFPVHASSSILLYLDDNLPASSSRLSSSSTSASSTSAPAIRSLEEKIGFLSSIGTAFPKLFDAAFGVVLDRAESSADFYSNTWHLSHSHTRILVESFLTERMQNISASSYLPRIFSLLHSISSGNVQAMEDDSGIPLHSFAQSLLSHILNTLCDLSFNSTSKSNESILWGVAGQWPIFWDLGDIGQALVLAALSGLDRGNQSSSTHNVHAVAGAVLGHALVKSPVGSELYSTLVAVLSVFNSQPGLLSKALDSVMEQIAPNPQMCSVVLGRLDDLFPFSATPPYSTLALNVSLHWEKILTFVTHPHLPLRLTSLRLLRSLLPVLYSQIPYHHPPGSLSNLPPQYASLIAKLPDKVTANSTHIFHPKSVRKLKMDAVSTQSIYRTLVTAFFTHIRQQTLDFEFIEALMNTIATTASLSVLHFGQIVALTLEFIFSPKSSDVTREFTSTPLLPMNSLPQAPSTNNSIINNLIV